ncbi:MAG: hypothetical protein QGG40_10355 [Myxococcota bacterium]|nr:hypothetical protein [Myxococcota bacterium]
MNRTLLALIVTITGCSDCRTIMSSTIPALQSAGPEFQYEPIQCDTDIATPAPKQCIVKTLACGDTVEGNTKVGHSKWGDDFYQKTFCTPQRHDYDESPEIVYALEVPADVEATVRMDSDCADLDVVAVSWNDTKQCPRTEHHIRINECEMDTSVGNGYVRMTTVTKAQTYLVGVDGKNGATGNFRLTVRCTTYR